MTDYIPFNKPYFTGKETAYIEDAVRSGKISGNGAFTHKCHQFFEARYGFKKVLLTTSCTDALEMAALLINIQPGDEVIMPSFTFVSTANAFVLRGARIVFIDCEADHPNMDADQLLELITPATKAIVVVHYAGIACQMEKIMALAQGRNIFVIEDAAQSIDSYYKNKPLGGIGHLSAFSFHETKNVISGEGGMLVVNDDQFLKRSEIIWEKGTNRAAFFRGEVNKYGWVDIGSSFLPSEIMAAFLYAQLENIDEIQRRRKEIWFTYYEKLRVLEEKNVASTPFIPDYATNNAHIFYLVCKNLEERTKLIEYLKSNQVLSVFHYLPLHSSEYFINHQSDRKKLPNCDSFSEKLLRLPLYYELKDEQIDKITSLILNFYNYF